MMDQFPRTMILFTRGILAPWSTACSEREGHPRGCPFLLLATAVAGLLGPLLLTTPGY
jgi:hypothetical protein